MPRVHTATRRRATVKFPMVCTACRQEIEVGQSYYKWERRHGGKKYRHTSCGRPRPTELSGRKTARIEEAVQDLDLSAWQPEIDWSGDEPNTRSDDLADHMSGVIEAAREVASEYEEGADNMPESLQYGSQAEAMRDVAERLNEWADELESFDPGTEPDWPEREEEEGLAMEDSTFVGECQDALESWADDIRSEAESQLGEIPEYEG